MFSTRTSLLPITFCIAAGLSACASQEKKAEKPAPEPVQRVQPAPPVKAEAVKPKLSKRDLMMRVALQMRGKPYRYSGATPAGFDASGLVYYSYKEVGLIAPREFKLQFEQSKPVPKDRIRPGDLLFFAIGTDKPNHVGIYLGTNKFMHAPPTHTKVIMSDIRSKKWADVLVRGGRL